MTAALRPTLVPCFLSPVVSIPSIESRRVVSSPARPAKWRCATVAGAPLKQKLLETIAPLDCGLSILNDPTAQKSVLEVIEELEQESPSVVPTQDINLPGAWRLVYTTSPTILGANRPKPLIPTKLLQFIAPTGTEILNVEYVEPFGPGKISWTNRIRVSVSVASDSRVNVQFVQFELFGPRIKFNTAKDTRFQGWLDITYLDENMRISRGSEDNVFVLVRDPDDSIENYKK